MNKKTFFHVLKSIGVFMSLLGMLIILLNTSTTMTSQAAESSQDTPLSISKNHPASRGPNGPTIIGGEEAEPGAWPWQVAVIVSDVVLPGPNFFRAQQCGGSLIHPEWVVTAAHCAPEVFPASGGNVVAGIHNLRSPESAYFQRMEISEIIRHPDYNSSTNENDIALFKLAEPVTLTDRVQILPMVNFTNTTLTISGTSAIVTGWGFTSSTGPKSDVLRELSVPIVSNEQCNMIYQDLDGPMITDGMICAGGVENKDSCDHDSGSPLVVPNANNDGYLLAGIVSFGSSRGCGAAGVPAVHTRVSHYQSWIAEKIRNTQDGETSPNLMYLPLVLN